ncbi:MAG: PAAR domain-containing protein [Pseudomonadota bacterium]
MRLIMVALAASALGGAVWAQTGTPPATGAPGIVTDGSKNTTVGGAAAARSGDRTTSGSAVVGGSKNVFINGKPAARVGDRTNCGGVAISGSSNVFVNGKPLVRSGDLTTGCN